MRRLQADPATALALAIITRAAKAWKRNGWEDDRDELLAFFHSDWFNFLFQSAVTKTTKGKMFKALGIPTGEVL